MKRNWLKNRSKKTTTESSLEKEMKREWKVMKHFKDENKLLFMGFVWLVVAILAINTIYVISARTDNNGLVGKTVTPFASHVLTSQQYAQTTAFAVHIDNVTETDKQDVAFPLLEGNTMLILDISITNNTVTQQDFYPVNQLFVRDQEGGNYAPHASIYITNPIPAESLKPGQTVSGQISFEIPKRLTRPLLYVDLGWDNQLPIVYDVLR